MNQRLIDHPYGDSPPEEAITNHGALMNRIYRHQRHLYDLTRRFFLLGRDALIQKIVAQPGDRILEIGCGTARNLIHLARRHPSAELFGIDASMEMLKSADANLTRAGLHRRVRLGCCLAEELSPAAMFESPEPFDVLFFSYSLSMMPQWQAALDKGLLNLGTGCSLWVVDFWDQADLPHAFAWTLRRWLGMFHVQHRPEVLEYFAELERSGVVTLSVEPLYRRYAYLAKLTKIA